LPDAPALRGACAATCRTFLVSASPARYCPPSQRKAAPHNQRQGGGAPDYEGRVVDLKRRCITGRSPRLVRGVGSVGFHGSSRNTVHTTPTCRDRQAWRCLRRVRVDENESHSDDGPALPMAAYCHLQGARVLVPGSLRCNGLLTGHMRDRDGGGCWTSSRAEPGNGDNGAVGRRERNRERQGYCYGVVAARLRQQSGGIRLHLFRPRCHAARAVTGVRLGP
jgi:hypothetical protein